MGNNERESLENVRYWSCFDFAASRYCIGAVVIAGVTGAYDTYKEQKQKKWQKAEVSTTRKYYERNIAIDKGPQISLGTVKPPPIPAAKVSP
jgi:hypothetical protein